MGTSTESHNFFLMNKKIRTAKNLREPYEMEKIKLYYPTLIKLKGLWTLKRVSMKSYSDQEHTKETNHPG